MSEQQSEDPKLGDAAHREKRVQLEAMIIRLQRGLCDIADRIMEWQIHEPENDGHRQILKIATSTLDAARMIEKELEP